MTAIEIFACRVFDQDWDEVAYRPTVEHLVALVHDGLNGLGLELWELLLEPAGDSKISSRLCCWLGVSGQPYS